MRYIFIRGPVSAQEAFLYCFGVSLGSTASRGWGSLDHLVMSLGVCLPQALSSRNCAPGGRYKGIYHKAFSWQIPARSLLPR